MSTSRWRAITRNATSRTRQGVVAEGVLHRHERYIVPTPQQSTGGPDPQPKVRACGLAGDHPTRRRTSESQNQLGVGGLSTAAIEQPDAPRHHLILAATRALRFHAFAWCLAP